MTMSAEVREISIGDIVQLKSGSLGMTVVKVADDVITVAWMSGGIVQQNSFPAAALERLA
jgi:uncharacterized protein YodC (DUF2158 family)